MYFDNITASVNIPWPQLQSSNRDTLDTSFFFWFFYCTRYLFQTAIRTAIRTDPRLREARGPSANHHRNQGGRLLTTRWKVTYNSRCLAR